MYRGIRNVKQQVTSDLLQSVSGYNAVAHMKQIYDNRSNCDCYQEAFYLNPLVFNLWCKHQVRSWLLTAPGKSSLSVKFLETHAEGYNLTDLLRNPNNGEVMFSSSSPVEERLEFVNALRLVSRAPDIVPDSQNDV